MAVTVTAFKVLAAAPTLKTTGVTANVQVPGCANRGAARSRTAAKDLIGNYGSNCETRYLRQRFAASGQDRDCTGGVAVDANGLGLAFARKA